MVNSFKTKRSYRRTRHIIKLKKLILDELVSVQIKQSFAWSSASYGGSRCPSCGLTCRPHHLTNLSNLILNENNKVIGHYTAFDGACDYIKCKGEKEWQ